jgi:hypothetical protein
MIFNDKSQTTYATRRQQRNSNLTNPPATPILSNRGNSLVRVRTLIISTTRSALTTPAMPGGNNYLAGTPVAYDDTGAFISIKADNYTLLKELRN